MSVSGAMTLLELRTAVRERANMEDTQFVTDPELTRYVNQSLQSLYNKLVTTYEDYFVSPTPYAFVTAETDKYDLPPDYFKELGMELQFASAPNGWLTLHRFTMAERNKWRYPGMVPAPGWATFQYRVMGSQIWLIPQPQTSGQTVRMWYVPRLPRLAADTDSVDMVSDNFIEYAILDSAIKCLVKEESDASTLMAERAQKLKELEEEASNRDAGEPEHVSDTRGANWPNGIPGGGPPWGMV
jgi:hypothetical protein